MYEGGRKLRNDESTHDWILTAIGDSITVGVGAPLHGKGYVRRYAAFTEDTFNIKISIHNFARTGDTSEEILDSLKTKEVRHFLKKSKIITISAGGNDLIQAGIRYFLTYKEEGLYHALMRCKKNISQIIKRILKIKRKTKESYIIRLCNLYNPYFNVKQAVKWVNKFNSQLRQLELFPHVKVADLYSAFKGRERELISWDSIHPNQKGYQVIAVALYELGYDKL
jgi:lysophospholipase L1-like esterase